jgi:lipopolysaccharide biosynthesis regulator YciM
LLARRGEIDRAFQLAQAAAATAEQTDMLNGRAEALADLAEVLELAGLPEEAARKLTRTMELYERKGNVVMAKQRASG